MSIIKLAYTLPFTGASGTGLLCSRVGEGKKRRRSRLSAEPAIVNYKRKGQYGKANCGPTNSPDGRRDDLVGRGGHVLSVGMPRGLESR